MKKILSILILFLIGLMAFVSAESARPLVLNECGIKWDVGYTCGEGLILGDQGFVAGDIITFGRCIKADGSSRCGLGICVNQSTDESYNCGVKREGDNTCSVDSDCIIKSTPYCCGKNTEYYNNCYPINEAPKEVNCASILPPYSCPGIALINSCRCENNKCVGKQEEPTPECLTDSECPDLDYNLPENNGKFFKCIEGKCKIQKNCPEGSVDEEGKCKKTLSNGIKAEIKIMPSTASEKAIERLGELRFNVTLKEIGNNKGVYELTAEKEGKMLGLFKVKGKVSAQVDAETGEIIKIHKPWWAFLISGI